eukprot:5269447-Alexandrium_andersonii.AAC.1
MAARRCSSDRSGGGSELRSACSHTRRRASGCVHAHPCRQAQIQPCTHAQSGGRQRTCARVRTTCARKCSSMHANS